MKKVAAILTILAWPLLCSFQQVAAPKSGKPNQESTTGSQTNTDANKQARVKSAPPAPAPDSINKDSDWKEANNYQGLNFGAPEKSVDSVARVVSILGAVCTLALTVVGIIGVCVGIKTLKALKIQAVIMRRQTRHTARQALSMRRQTAHLRNSVEAARAGVEVTQKSIEMIISKERAPDYL